MSRGLACPRGTLDREVDGLGPTGREDDGAGLRADAPGQPLMGLVEGLPGAPPEPCGDEGLAPSPSRCGSMASSTSGRSGDEAA